MTGARRFLARVRAVIVPMPLCAWLAAGLWCGLACDFGLQIYDEGSLLLGARSVAHGGVPTREFWTAYPPGIFWLVGLAFRLFGDQIIVNRVLHALITLGVCVAAWHVLVRLVPRRAALWGFLAVALYAGGLRLPAGYPPPVCLLLGFWSLTELLGVNPLPRGGRLWRAGLAAGLCAIIRYDIALYLLAASVSGASLAVAAALADWAGRRREAVRLVAGYSAGFLVPVIAGYGVLVALAGAGPVYTQLVEFPLHVFPRVRDLPLERPFEVFVTTSPRDWQLAWLLPESTRLLPFAATAVAVAGVWQALVQRRHATAPLLFALSVLALACFNQYRVRSGASHAWPLVVTALLLVPPLFVSMRESRSRLMRAASAIALTIGAAILVPDMLSRGIALLTDRYLRPTVAVDSPAATGIRISATETTTNAVLAYLRTHAAGERYIFSGTVDHDQVMFNDALIYFLAGRLSPTPYPDLVPGLIDTAPVQRQVVAALNGHAVRTVVLFNYVSTEPNQSSQNTHVDILDRFLSERFRPEASFPPYYTVLRRAYP